MFFYAHPGAIILKDTVEYIKSNFSNMKTVDIGEGLHFIQEDNPHQIGEEIGWYSSTSKMKVKEILYYFYMGTLLHLTCGGISSHIYNHWEDV